MEALSAVITEIAAVILAMLLDGKTFDASAALRI